MNCVRKLRSWTPEQREIQSRKLRERKIWLVSTGPKTASGKEKSSRNSTKHGQYSRANKAKRKSLRDLLALYRQFTKIYHNIARNPKILTNELRDYALHLHEIIMMQTEFWSRKYLEPPPLADKSPIL